MRRTPSRLIPAVGELLDAPQLRDVRLAVAADAATGAGRIEQTFALVDAQRLGMDAGELGGDRDHVDRRVGLGGPVVVGHRRTPEMLPRRACVERLRECLDGLPAARR